MVQTWMVNKMKINTETWFLCILGIMCCSGLSLCTNRGLLEVAYTVQSYKGSRTITLAITWPPTRQMPPLLQSVLGGYNAASKLLPRRNLLNWSKGTRIVFAVWSFFVVGPLKVEPGRLVSELTPVRAQTARKQARRPPKQQKQPRPAPKQQKKMRHRPNHKNKHAHPPPPGAQTAKQNTTPSPPAQTAKQKHDPAPKQCCLSRRMCFAENQILLWRDGGRGWGLCFLRAGVVLLFTVWAGTCFCFVAV